ncbi:DUF4129 domain-containing protein [uncultured Chloroflexus sp.]|uniref:DUF4129 domain-containing protein n=1 Tax=uncultured Chloroflexus sp. TaxID=214040 RepID=UPI00261F7E78|nr:DUF4129 domain-containing protein [uncultured Chloroflexus sp.]
MIRLLRIVLLAAFETTLVALPLLALAAIALPWPGLFGAVLLGWLADGAARRLCHPFHYLPLVLAPLLAATGLLWLAIGGDPLALWPALLPGQPQSGLAYVAALVAFFLTWRGAGLESHDSATILTFAGRGMIAAIASLLVGPLVRAGAAVPADALLTYVAVAIGTGLGSLALSHVIETSANRTVDGRWSLLLLGVVGSVLAIGAALTALLSGEAALDGVVNLLRFMLLPLALIGAVLVYLFTVIFGDLIRALVALLGQALAQMNLRPEPPPVTDTAPIDDAAIETVIALAQQATFWLALIPLAVLLVLLIWWRRRARRVETDEERESLDVGQSLLADVRDLLGALRNPFQRRLSGLQAALAALRGADPVTRVRRAYIQVLLALEERGLRRPPAQTPSEWYTTVAPTLPDPAPLAELTAIYERARYQPSGVAPADAAIAEQASQMVRQ